MLRITNPTPETSWHGRDMIVGSRRCEASLRGSYGIAWPVVGTALLQLYTGTYASVEARRGLRQRSQGIKDPTKTLQTNYYRSSPSTMFDAYIRPAGWLQTGQDQAPGQELLGFRGNQGQTEGRRPDAGQTSPEMSHAALARYRVRARACPMCLLLNKPNIKHTYIKKSAQ